MPDELHIDGFISRARPLGSLSPDRTSRSTPTTQAEFKATDRYVLSVDTGRIWLLTASQPWWEYFTTHTREDGDGRPISLTLWKVARGTISNFRIQSPPFWSNAVAESSDVVYNGMFINATNTNPVYAGQKYDLSILFTAFLTESTFAVLFQIQMVSTRIEATEYPY